MAAVLEDDQEQDSYYALLNVSKEASSEQINAAYRRMCIIYHPDKHEDPEKKTAAETLFGRLKEAHAVLSDPEKRIVYDVYGKKGLEASWELVPRTRTQSEIREEYERLQRRQEEERLQQATNPRGRTSVAINATDLFESYDDEYEAGELEISGITMSQQIDAPLTRKDTLTLSGTMIAKNGRGHGQVGVLLRHVVTPSKWFEVDCSAGTGLFLGGRVFMNLTRFTYGMAGLGFVSTPAGTQPVVTGSLTRRLSDHTSGSLIWKSGDEQSMTSSVVMDTENHRLALTFQLGVPDIHARFSYVYKYQQDTRAHVTGKAGTMGLTFEYGMDTKITKHSWVGATVAVGVPIGVKLKIKVTRSSQEFIFPIELASDAIVPEAIFYGTVLPIAAYWAIKVFLINPFMKRRVTEELLERQEEAVAVVNARKREAELAVRLMKDAYERSVNVERERHGLVVVEAWFGKLVGAGEQDHDKVVDVVIPLQCQVKDSKLILQSTSKSSLPGFYDPCVGEEKSLRVVYDFRDALHEVTLKDTDSVAIPKQSHKLD